MLILQGILRSAQTIGGGIKKSGERIPFREVLQVETLDSRGLVKMDTITVPDLKPYKDKIGQKVQVPVRAWAPGAQVSFMFDAPEGAA